MRTEAEREWDAAIVGAGVVGLALAARLTQAGRRVVVLERRAEAGRGQSGNNSGVIHGGYLVPPGTLKAKLCVRGRPMLYDYCERRGVAHRRCGALTLDDDGTRKAYLDKLARNAREMGVRMEEVGREFIAQHLPHTSIQRGLFAPEVGLVDSAGLVSSLRAELEAAGGRVMFGRTVRDAQAGAEGWTLHADGMAEGAPTLALKARQVANCAGIYADEVAARVGGRYKLYPVRGAYAYLDRPLSVPIYPSLHEPNHPGKGVHLTPTLDGRTLVGPSAHHIATKEGAPVGPADMAEFEEGVRSFFAETREGALTPGFVGVRAKLTPPGEPERDFVIQEAEGAGRPGWFDLVGIESPGLTACLAIAEHTAGLMLGAKG